MSDRTVKSLTTLGGYGEDRFEEKKSVFIGMAKPVSTEEEAMAFVKEIKSKYADATHNVWAYSLNDGACARYSDDGEPQGTGGVPMLETIKKSGVQNMVAVVTRYFGGTLLGAGGLVRAYTKGCRIAIEAAGIVTYEPFTILEVLTDYSDYQKIQNDLPNWQLKVDDTEFANDVTIRLAVKSTQAEELKKKFSEMTNGRVFIEEVGTRLDF